MLRSTLPSSPQAAADGKKQKALLSQKAVVWASVCLLKAQVSYAMLCPSACSVHSLPLSLSSLTYTLDLCNFFLLGVHLEKDKKHESQLYLLR